MNCNLQGLVLTTNISEQWVKTLSEKTTIKLLFREIILLNLRQGQLLLSLLKATIKQFHKNLITQLFQENKTFKKEFQALWAATDSIQSGTLPIGTSKFHNPNFVFGNIY